MKKIPQAEDDVPSVADVRFDGFNDLKPLRLGGFRISQTSFQREALVRDRLEWLSELMSELRGELPEKAQPRTCDQAGFEVCSAPPREHVRLRCW